MKGRAQHLFSEFQRKAAEAGNAFGVCRVILLARVVPEHLTSDLDDPELEQRLERAIDIVLEEKRGLHA